MTPVIRSSRFHDEPLILVRVQRGNAREASDSRAAVGSEAGNPITFGYEPSIANLTALDIDAASVAGGPDVADVMSYEAYRSRFQEELDALRAQTREAAHREGRTEGLQEGQRAGEAEFSDRLERLDALLASAREAIERGLDGLADTAVEVVFEAVVRILGTQFAEKSGTEAMVREVIRQSKERSKLVVRLAPSDYELLRDRHADLADGLKAGQVDIVADDLVELGGCVLETPSGTLDGRLEIQLQRLRDTLLTARLKWHEHGD